MTPWQKRGYVAAILLVGLLPAVIALATTDEGRRFAVGSLGVAGLALVLAAYVSATLENRVAGLAQDVRRIADAIAPIESTSEPERLDRVEILTSRDIVVEIDQLDDEFK